MQGLLKLLSQLVSLLYNPLFLISAIIIIVVLLVIKDKEYKKGTYYQVTKHPYLSVRFNIGRYGEYLTYKYLKKFEKGGAKFLFNIYIPKEKDETTEIDVLMICNKGLFVFESKNYSGWIFGSENQKYWYQTLPAGKGRSHKEQFYNPIMQNRSHIKHLKAFLGEQIPMRSIIVFSDRCTLKSVQTHSTDISVINRYGVATVVNKICKRIPDDLLADKDITEIYRKLYPYTQVDENTKKQHIADIQNKKYSQSARQDKEAPGRVTSQVRPETAAEQPEAIIDTTIGAENNEDTEPTKDDENRTLKCPRCNGNLVLRTATRGANAGKQFYGCSNFPKCKYTQSITK